MKKQTSKQNRTASLKGRSTKAYMSASSGKTTAAKEKAQREQRQGGSKASKRALADAAALAGSETVTRPSNEEIAARVEALAEAGITLAENERAYDPRQAGEVAEGTRVVKVTRRNAKPLPFPIYKIEAEEAAAPAATSSKTSSKRAASTSKASITKMEDVDVENFVRKQLKANPEATVGGLLKLLRQSGLSCEQSRFRGLAKPIVDEHRAAAEKEAAAAEKAASKKGGSKKASK